MLKQGCERTSDGQRVASMSYNTPTLSVVCSGTVRYLWEKEWIFPLT